MENFKRTVDGLLEQFGKVEDELTNHKITVKNLEEKIEKSEKKVSELEEKLKEYESRNDSWDETETDSASPKVPEKKIREINRPLKVLEEKDQKAQEALNPSQDDMEGDSEFPICQNLQNSLDDAFVKCQNFVKKRKICLSENELIELSAFEFVADVKKGPVWQIAHHCLSDCYKRFDEELAQRKLQRQDKCTIVQCLYLESCIRNFNGNSQFFYVMANPDKTNPSILEINPNRIALRNVKDKAERHVCSMDQIQAVDREDKLITLVIVNGSNQHTEIFQPKLEESQQIFDMLQHFRRKSNSLNTQAALESTGQEAQDDLETEFTKYQERLRQRHVRLEKQDMIELAAYERKAGIRNGLHSVRDHEFDRLFVLKMKKQCEVV